VPRKLSGAVVAQIRDPMSHTNRTQRECCDGEKWISGF